MLFTKFLVALTTYLIIFVSIASSRKYQDNVFNDFEMEGLQIHNEYRARHGVPPLYLNKEICKWAQDWANYLAENEVFKHRPDNKYGENLYYIWHSSLKPKLNVTAAVEGWYDEIVLYNYNVPVFSKATGHFTALIWKNTRELGLAHATNFQTGKAYIVANYSPWPNVRGAFADNVLPLIFATSPVALYEDDQAFENHALQIHNELREKHGVPSLSLNREISNYAKDWAYRLAMNNVLEYRYPNKYGENIHVYENSDFQNPANVSEAIQGWYDEIKSYNYSKPASSRETRHFTALIWKNVEELGIARVTNKLNSKTYIVANYNPLPNVEGTFSENVHRSNTSSKPGSNLALISYILIITRLLILKTKR